MSIVRTIGGAARARSRRRAAGGGRPGADDGRAARRAPRAARAPREPSATSSSRASSSTRRSSASSADLDAYPRDPEPTRAVARGRRRRRPLRPGRRRDVPAGLRDLGRARGAAERPRGRVPAGPLPRRRDRLPEALQHRPAASAPTSAARTRSRSPWSSSSSATSTSTSRSVSCRPSATPTGSRSRHATRSSPPTSARRALAIPRALATGDPGRGPRRARRGGLEPEYVAVADLDGPTLAVAVLVGSTRLIDNVPLEGDPHDHPPPHARPERARPRQAPAHRARRDEAARRADRDGHRLRLPERRASPTRPASTSCSSATRRR